MLILKILEDVFLIKLLIKNFLLETYKNLLIDADNPLQHRKNESL